MGFWTNETGQTTSKLTEEEYLFLKEYVDNMSESREGSLITYTKDFILTEEHRKIINNLQKLFADYSEEWAYEERYQKNRDYNPRLYDADESIMYDIVDIFEKDKEFFVEIHVSFDVYNEEEDEEDEEEDEEDEEEDEEDEEFEI